MAGRDAAPLTVAFYVVSMLLTGTMNTLTTKIQFTMYSVGLDGKEEPFRKPWYGTLNMLTAMLLVGVISEVAGLCTKPRKAAANMAPLIEDGLGQSGARSQKRKYCLCAIPASFDLAATALGCTGMMYIPASVWQMMRGACIIFAALFSITLLKRRMHCHNWVGLAFVVAGICGVGAANLLGGGQASSGYTPAGMLLGMSLVLCAQVVQAAQIVAEEWLMKDVDLPGMQIIGLEGFWGTLIMVLFIYPALYALPGSDRGHLEDPFDTYTMLLNSPQLMHCICVYLFSCATFNASGIAVSGALSSVHRMMFDASRTMVIWSVGLAVHYFYDPSCPFGEVLTPYSGLQLGAFFVIVTGQAIYGEVIKLPGIAYPVPAKVLLPSPSQMINLASPLPCERDEQ
mmetsp:Transcript_13743/g.31132  ORF Transcript_13743/g.31132 Transcript_13743/m.31132 type:complete len:399 (-) Transcript_13743:52-1248(-)